MQPKQNPPAQPLAAPTATSSATAAAGALVEIAARLVAIMDRETALLGTMKIRDANALQDEKTRLARAFEERARALKGNAGLVATLTAEIKSELRDAIKRFDEAAKANAIAIKAARDANEHLLQAIVDAVSAKRTAAQGYGATGARSAPRSCKPEALSLTLDDRF
ncbi:MAG TPA: hypothetical protein VF274_01250 [Alphaproteobacteria bacterium]|jgi:formate-dependent nitrite reductase cytochrome c552 subunit